MIVYVESNFVLELALQQEQCEAAESVLRLAELGQIELAFPDFSLSESFARIRRLHDERKRLYESMRQDLTQLERSAPHQQIASAMRPLMEALSATSEQELDSLESTVARMLDEGRAIALDGTIFRNARSNQARYGLRLPDAIIYCTVLADLAKRSLPERRCFMSRDYKAFGDPGIASELRSYDCAYLADFQSGLGFIQRGTE